MLPPEFFDDIWAFVPLSSQGGYTVANRQKEISWWRAPTQLVLYFEGVAVPTADPQLLIKRAPVTALVEIPKGGADDYRSFSLGCAWQWRPEEDRFCILPCLSCDQVGRRFITTNTQNSRNCFSRWTDFPQVLISVLWGNVRGNAAVFWRLRSLGMEVPICADWKVRTSHQSSGCWRETVSQEGIRQNKLCCRCWGVPGAHSTKGGQKASLSPSLLGLTHTKCFSTRSRNKM